MKEDQKHYNKSSPPSPPPPCRPGPDWPEGFRPSPQHKLLYPGLVVPLKNKLFSDASFPLVVVGFVNICFVKVNWKVSVTVTSLNLLKVTLHLLLTSPDPEGAPLPPVVPPGVGDPPELLLALLAPAKYPHCVLSHHTCPGVGVDARLVQEEVLAVLVVL